ncbi:MAG: ribosomal protein S18-alanine N-acetyltransferase [Caldilineaceae bacterium]
MTTSSAITQEQGAYTLTCEPMTVADLGQVSALEVDAFPAPRSAAFYQQEITQNRYATYRVLHAVTAQTAGTAPIVVAYGGYWLLGEDAHIVAIAVAPGWRRRGLAAWLMLELIETAWQQGAELVTLEMRINNRAADALYRKLGFQEVGRRKRYYRDNDEDALLFSLEGLRAAQTQHDLTTQLDLFRSHFRQS